MMFAVFMLLILKTAQALKEIQVSCGQLHIEGYSSCEIKHDNHVLTYTGPAKEELVGPFFGLITYKCDQTAGYMMSEIDCERCNFNCSEDELPINSCETDIAQFWAGVIIGGLLSILIGGVLWNRFNPTSSDHRFRNSVNVVFSDDQATIKENKNVHDTGNSTPRKTLRSVIAGLLLFKTSEACDVSVVMAAGNNITSFCQGSECGPHLGSFNVQHGTEICISDHMGESVSLKVSEVTWRYSYELAYYTSDYAYNFDFASNCCWHDEFFNYANGYSCKPVEGENCENNALYRLRKKASSTATAELQCVSTRNWSGKGSVAIVAYLLEREEKGELFRVFTLKSKESIIESITLILESGNHSQAIKIPSFDPTYELDLRQFKLQGIDRVPISIIEGKRSADSSKETLLQHNNKFYYNWNHWDLRINVSNPNQTLKNPDYRIDCKYQEGCAGQCSVEANESPVSKFLRQKNNYQEASNIIVRKNDSSVVLDAFDSVTIAYSPFELQMRLGSLTVNDFKKMKGRCDVTFLGHFGCSACNESAYVVLETKNIENEGLMPFHSNCSFDRNSINCDPYKPTKLVLKGNQETCFIKPLSRKKKFVVNLNYSVFGHQTKTKHLMNCTKTYSGYGDVLIHFVTGEQLIKALFGTMLLFFVFGLFAKIVFVFFNKFNAPLNTVDKEETLVEL